MALYEHLVHSSYTWLFLTVGVYVGCEKLWRMSGKKIYLIPAVWSLIITAILVLLSGIDYRFYKSATALVSFLLTTSTVVLAFPIYRQWPRLRKNIGALGTVIVVGAITASLTAYIAALAMPDRVLRVTALVKSITTPIAMAVADKIHANSSLAAALVFVVGIVGSITAPYVLNIVGIRHPMWRGMVFGITAHGLGTAQALQESEECGAFSGLAMGLAGIVTAIIVPVVIYFVSAL